MPTNNKESVLNEPILCTEDDKAAANEAFDYLRFSLSRHGHEPTDETDACADLVLAIVRYMKAGANAI